MRINVPMVAMQNEPWHALMSGLQNEVGSNAEGCKKAPAGKNWIIKAGQGPSSFRLIQEYRVFRPSHCVPLGRSSTMPAGARGRTSV